jgi:predicted DNA-binding transcriptional regulator YafY
LSSRIKGVLIRQWELVMELQRHPGGVGRQRLIELTGIPSTTLHRLIGELRDYGVPIETRTRNGEAWHALAQTSLPALGISATQLLALRLARRMLGVLEGTAITRELDGLLQPHALRDSPKPGISIRTSVVQAPTVVEVLDRAIQQGRRVRIRVRTRGNQQLHDRLLDPLCLRCTTNALYLAAFDHGRGEIRKFKVARIEFVQKLSERTREHLGFDEDKLFANAVKVGTGEPVDVAVRFSASVAKIVREYPLAAAQTFEDCSDGSVILRGRVAGTHEALRYVLSWGRDAEVLSPHEFRQEVALELAAATRRYTGKILRRTERALPRIVDRG